MAWEQRGKRKYYYRTRRVGDEVRKEYFGHGPQALAAAQADEAARKTKQREREQIRRMEDRVLPLKELMAELDEGVRLLTAASLLAANYHQHRGHWRRRRDRNKD